MSMDRYLAAPVLADLAEKMVFVAGPRQVGKTTLAKKLLETIGSGFYYDWDNRADRHEIRAAHWPGDGGLVVLDELHKWRIWKSWIKGEFDRHRDRVQFLVTGSARMDVFRRGGDSLQGRYHHYRLHPLTLREIDTATRGLDPSANPCPEPGVELTFPRQGSVRGARSRLEELMQFGGFPEAFFAQSARTLRRWQKARFDRFLREDIRDLESVRDLSSLELLADLLPERVGSPLSLNALREDLEVSHRSVGHWMDIFERLYHVFRIRPWASQKVRMLRQMPKVYLWDASSVPTPGPRFENLIALHLLKLCHLLQDRDGHDVELCYLRDRTGREVDFLVRWGKRPWFAVEAKTSATRIDPALTYFRDRLHIPWVYQVVLEGERDFVEKGVRCLPAHRFLSALI